MGKLSDLSNFSYQYAMGRIRAREKHMLRRSQFDHMIEAKTAEEAYQVLLDAGYGDRGDSAKSSARDYERLLDAEGVKLSSFISEISPEPRLLEIFLLRYDYHNIKVLLKSEFSEAPGAPLLSDSGLMPIGILSRVMNERLYSELHPVIMSGVLGAIDSYRLSLSAQAPDPRCIDIRLDHAMYAHMLIEAHMLGCPFVSELIQIYIDTANIGAFLRVREMNGGTDLLVEALIPDGEIESEVFERHFEENLDGFIGAMRYTRYDRLCAEGVKSYQATGHFTQYEKEADNFINSHLQRVKLFRVGPEIVVAYFLARLAELKNIRIVMIGKINGIDQDTIRERLRECYA